MAKQNPGPDARVPFSQVPPDSAAQVAMQFAHYLLHGFMPPTYESCSTRRSMRCVRDAPSHVPRAVCRGALSGRVVSAVRGGGAF